MSNPYLEQPRCRSCGLPFSAPVQICPGCRASQFAPPPPPVVYGPGPPKSILVAVVLGLLWLGLGQLYVGKVGFGVALVVTEFFLILLSFSMVGLVLSIPVYCVLLPLSVIMAAVAAQNSNRAGAMPAIMR